MNLTGKTTICNKNITPVANKAEVYIKRNISRELGDFILNHSRLYIYGNGRNQRRLKEYFDNKQLKIEGFVVSENYFDGSFNTISTTNIGKIEKDEAKIGIIISLIDVHYNSILRELLSNNILIDDVYILSGVEKERILTDGKKKTDKKDSTVSIDCFLEYSKKIASKGKAGRYNIILHRHLGDSLVLIALHSAFKEKYGSEPFYIVQSNQEVLMKMYGISDYNTFTFQGLLDEATNKAYPKHEIDSYRENLFERMFTAIPQKNEPFIAAPTYWIQEKLGWQNFIDGWAKMIGLSCNRIPVPTWHPELSEKARKVIENIDKIENIMVIAPEAQTFSEVSKVYWNNLANRLAQEGYSVIVNVTNPQNSINAGYEIDLSLQDLLALCYECQGVYSLRSGLCDCLASLGKKLHVYYKKEMRMEYFSINDCFEVNEEVFEEYIK